MLLESLFQRQSVSHFTCNFIIRFKPTLKSGIFVFWRIFPRHAQSQAGFLSVPLLAHFVNITWVFPAPYHKLPNSKWPPKSITTNVGLISWKAQFLYWKRNSPILSSKGHPNTIFTKGRCSHCLFYLHFDCELPAACFAFCSLKGLLMVSGGRLSEMADWIKGFSFNIQMTHWSWRIKQMTNRCPFVWRWRWDCQLANQWLTFGWIKPPCYCAAIL